MRLGPFLKVYGEIMVVEFSTCVEGVKESSGFEQGSVEYSVPKSAFSV